MALADFNGDGKGDIAVQTSELSISVFLGRGDGTFQDPIVTDIQVQQTSPPTYLLQGMAVADFNEDGKADLLVGLGNFSHAVILLSGNGDGTFAQGPVISDVSSFDHASVADLNSDGHLDLVTLTSGVPFVYLGNGDGTFTAANRLTPPNGVPIAADDSSSAIADFNGDHKPDILLCSYDAISQNGQADSAPSELIFYAGNGDGTFQAPVAAEFPNFSLNIANGDFNGDGIQAILIGQRNGTVQGSYITLGSPHPVWAASSWKL
jgi:FG-GAP-like repeat